jgi:hypothetical protein
LGVETLTRNKRDLGGIHFYGAPSTDQMHCLRISRFTGEFADGSLYQW